MYDRSLTKHKWKQIRWNWDLYLLLLPTVAYFIIFCYVPMYGILIAFEEYSPVLGALKSPWLGLQYFEEFISTYQFANILKNTLTISLYSFFVGFPLPIICSLLLNQLESTKFKRFIQTVTYAPNFISTIVIVGMLLTFLSPSGGMLSKLITVFTKTPNNYLAEPDAFKHIYVWSGIWQGLGVSMIIYIAALTGIDPQLHEAAMIDGASKFKRIIHIDIPGIMPTVSVLLIMNIGNIMSVGFEKVYLMQNSLNLATSEIISTYVYKVGLLKVQYSYSSAIGLFNSIVNCILLVLANTITARLGESSLW